MTQEEEKIRRKVYMGIVEEFFEEMGRTLIEDTVDKERIEYLLEQLSRPEQKELFKKPNVVNFLKDHGFRYELAAPHAKAIDKQWDSKSMTIGSKRKTKVKFL
jgi:signal recognition particle GTPase